MLLLTLEGLEIHDEALVAAETRSIVEVVGVDKVEEAVRSS